MQVKKPIKNEEETGRSALRFGTKAILMGIAGVLVVASLYVLGYWFFQHKALSSQTITTNGSSRWVDDTQTTAASATFTPPDAQLPVDNAFSAYYNSHAGAATLGAALTPGLPIAQGIVQFFAGGALFLPSSKPTSVKKNAADSAVDSLISDSTADKATGVYNLPLLRALLTLGSQAVVGGNLTYVDLRKATDPDDMVSEPTRKDNAVLVDANVTDPVFVPGGSRDGKTVGHFIPAALWNYLNNPEVSPDGWQSDWGLPLTEALPFTDKQHKILIQVFWLGALIEDEDKIDSVGQATITELETGPDFLQTVGLPTVTLGGRTTAWAGGDTPIFDAPAGKETVHVGVNFPLKLVGDTKLVNGVLWYHIQWQARQNAGEGWVPATAATLNDPGTQPAWASFDVLSPDLVSYLSNLSPHIAAVAYDLTRGYYYTFNQSGRFITGSSIKVFIMSAFYNMIEQQGREPNDTENGWLTIMIENSDNDAATALYNEIGRAAGMNRFLQQVGITDFAPDNVSWGYSLITPLAMVHLLTMLHDGKILSDAHRQQAFFWMTHIELDQRNGACLTAPKSASFCAMKDGWLPGPDGYWAANSSGIITVGQETYIVSVYTNGQNALADNWGILNHVYGVISSLLP
ncbi:MAG TPA: serine hydrolase [Ktedonobacterales bacterium]